MINTYLFDMDNTFIDVTIYARMYDSVLDAVKRELSLSDEQLNKTCVKLNLGLNEFGRYDSGELCSALGLLDLYYCIFEEHIGVENYLHQDIVAIFTKIKENGSRVGVASNSMHRTIATYLKKYGLVGYVDFFYGCDDAGCKKQNILYWKNLIAKEQINPAVTIMIGDNYVDDIATPAQLGFSTFHVTEQNPLQNLLIEVFQTT